MLSKAVWSRCMSGVLSSSETGGRWDPTGTSLLSSSRVTLGEWRERTEQLQDVTAVLWDNMAVPALAEFRYTRWRKTHAPQASREESYRTLTLSIGKLLTLPISRVVHAICGFGAYLQGRY